MLTDAAKAQMAANDKRHAEQTAANLAAETRRYLDAGLTIRHLVFLTDTWRNVGTQERRHGMCIRHDTDEGTVTILEASPEMEPCLACAHVPAEYKLRLLTVPEDDVYEVQPIQVPTGVASKLLVAACQHARRGRIDKARQLIGWASELLRTPQRWEEQ